MSANYRQRADSFFDDVPQRRRWQQVYREALGADSGKVLDVGCGSGTEALVAADMGFDVTVLDMGPHMVANAKEVARGRGFEIDGVVGDAEHLPFPDASFDFVISNNMLWLVPHPEKAIAEFYRVLRPGGRVAYIDGWWSQPAPFWRRAWSRWASRQIAKEPGRVPTRPYTPEEAESMGQLWSRTAERPARDFEMMADAGFEGAHTIDRFNRILYRGANYLKYGYTKVHFVMVGARPSDDVVPTRSIEVPPVPFAPAAGIGVSAKGPELRRSAFRLRESGT